MSGCTISRDLASSMNMSTYVLACCSNLNSVDGYLSILCSYANDQWCVIDWNLDYSIAYCMSVGSIRFGLTNV
jgi:hypothetical protein